ncbi:hypothetical protein BTHERMOSOX_61 [Bathymodiolus thermophilus thioautotrophic gill symbiont]|nr:hypothetical protein BTHERMOSOX_61 [Bathymodiolus thermophilus thioautotrophic gill symbiont]
MKWFFFDHKLVGVFFKMPNVDFFNIRHLKINNNRLEVKFL